jgi:hypothetical protein
MMPDIRSCDRTLLLPLPFVRWGMNAYSRIGGCARKVARELRELIIVLRSQQLPSMLLCFFAPWVPGPEIIATPFYTRLRPSRPVLCCLLCVKHGPRLAMANLRSFASNFIPLPRFEFCAE